MKLLSLFVFFSCFAYSQHYEEYKVSVHQIHVNVVDKKGEPIKGLTSDKFKVKIDGKEQTVLSVTPVSLRQEVVTTEVVPEHARRMFVFVFDTMNNTPRGLINAREEVGRFIFDEMLAHDLGAVFTMNGRNIRMVSNFTGDKAQLIQAVKTFGFDEIGSTLHKVTGYVTNPNARDKDGMSAKEAFQSLSKQYIESEEMFSLFVPGKYDNPIVYINAGLHNIRREGKKGEALAYFDQFESLAAALRVIEGRKNMILFSAGMKGGLGVGAVLQEAEDIEDFAVSGNVMSSSRRLVEALQGSGTVVFTLDTSREAGMSQQKSNLQLLNDISSSSGGRVYTNTENFGSVLKEIKDITSDYYLVNIQTDLVAKKGELFKLKVSVDAPKARVYTTRGVLLKPDFENLDPMEKALMMSNFISKDMISKAIPAEVDVIRVPRKGEATRLFVQAQVPGSYFLGLKEGNKPTEFEVMAALIDKEGDIMVDQEYRHFNLVPQQARAVFEKTGLKYTSDLYAKPGVYKLKFFMRNLRTGESASLIEELTIEEQRQEISGPHIVSNEPWVVIHGLGNEAREAAVSPFRFQGARFVPEVQEQCILGERANFLFLIDAEKMSNQPEVAVLIVDQGGAYQMPKPEALISKSYAGEEQSNPHGLQLSLDMSGLQLISGKEYTFMARIGASDKQPLLAKVKFTAL